MERKHGAGPEATRESSAETLGRYTLLCQIAQSELSTVYLARQQNKTGFQRLLAVKRLRAERAKQPESAQLILDEARLISSLHHANLVSAIDAGTEGGAHVVMDYVEGADLAFLLEKAGKERQARLIVPLIVDVLNGLHMVHTALDSSGEPLRLVHQAPRARHVLVGVDGTARLCDFSQARARVIAPSRQRSDRLRVFAMAPEQALSPDYVDHRADVFVLGLLLWEALTGEALFAAESDEQTFQNLLHRRVPRPSELGARPPRCFDGICLRALERDPKNRYASALDMARDLRDTALNQALYATSAEIGQWVKALAGSVLLERRRKAGSDAPLPDVVLGRAPSTSGFYEASKADPYGSGLIYGGSFTRVGHGHAPRVRGFDPDKTPAVGVKLRESTPENPFARVSAKRPRADEPTGPLPAEQRLRKTTEPMWTMPEGSERSSPPMDDDEETAVGKAPPLPDAEETHPAGFVPAKAGARRDAGIKSPGAYSAFSERKSRPSTPAAFDAIEDAKTGLHGVLPDTPTARESSPGKESAHGSLPPLGAGAPFSPPASRPLQAGAQSTRDSTPGATSQNGATRVTEVSASPSSEASKSRPRAAIDAPSPLDSRLDSTPARRSLPPAPVGSPYRDARPSTAPEQFDRPKRPRALEDRTGKTRVVDVLRVTAPTAPDSLAPPDSGARTLPPPPFAPAEPARPSRLLWAVTGVLAAIIVTALGVSAGKWLRRGEPSRVYATQPSVPARDVAEPAPAAGGDPARSLAEPAALPSDSAALPLENPAQDQIAPFVDSDSAKAQALGKRLEKAKRAPADEAPEDEAKPNVAPAVETPETPEKVHRTGAKAEAGPAIPDNPY